MEVLLNNSVFLILFIALTAFMAFFPFVLRKFRIPGVIALLIAGILLGQTWGGSDIIGFLSVQINRLLGVEYPYTIGSETSTLFNQFIQTLGSLGLIFLMALAGMEADFRLVKDCRKVVTALSVFTFLVPAITGYFVYAYFRPDDMPGKVLYASLFASHSVGIVFPVIRGLKLSKTRYGAAILISTVITDIASIILLAVSVRMFMQEHSTASKLLDPSSLSIFDRMETQTWGNGLFFMIFLSVVLAYLVCAVTIVSKVSEKLMNSLKPHEDVLITIMLLIILVTVITGEILGINSVVGAFIAGLGLSRTVRDKDMLLFKKFESIGYGFLIPFLFISIGMQTDVSAFTGGNDITLILLTIAGLVGSKLLSGYLAMTICHYQARPAIAAGLMTVPQLSATLAAAAIGKSIGMLDDHFFNAVIILSIVTTLPIPSLVQLVLEGGKQKFTHLEGFEIPAVVKDDELL